jgi:hypothetical protein
MILEPHIPTKFCAGGLSDGSANVNLGIRTFIPMQVGEIVLFE